MKKILATVVLVAVILAGVLCAINYTNSAGENANKDTNKLQVVATYYPLYDFAKKIGGDTVQVINVTPAGAEPHDYEPSPKALADTQKADVFIYNGGHMEPWVDNFVKDYRGVAVKANTDIDMLQAKEEDAESAASAGHPDRPSEHGEYARQQVQDPHFWLDPVLAKQIVDNIQNGLSKADPANEEYYTQNAAVYKEKLDQLDADYRQGLALCQTRTIVSSHDAFSYLGKRYNLTIASIAGLSPEEEPSAGKLTELSQLVRKEGINYVFFESLVSPRLADTIATETGAKTLVFNPIEGLTNADQEQGKDYLSIQRENLANLRTALACQ